MKIKYLGTAAAEGIPALFCHCDICNHARLHKGKEIRTRCQAMIDDAIMLDFGPDNYMHLLTNDLDITELEYCLITHSHDDHFSAEQFYYRNPGYAVLKEGTKPLTVYGNAEVGKMLMEGESSIANSKNVKFQQIEPFCPQMLGDYEVTAFPAVHGSDRPLFYSIRKGEKTILYAHDTDIFKEDVWEYFEKERMYFDLISMDCTEGLKKMNYSGHMNFEKNLLLKEMMIEKKLADEKTVFVANHFSHNGHVSYEEAERYGNDHGIVISYDRMEIELD